MTKLKLLAGLLLSIMLVSCGGSASSGIAGSSKVTVRVGGDGRTAQVSIGDPPSVAAALHAVTRLLHLPTAEAAIPASVTDIAITISATDMPDMTTTVHVAGRTVIEETFSVPNGSNRCIAVEAKNEVRTEFKGVRYVNLDGTPVSVVITMENVAAPRFEGLASATAASSTEIDLAWKAASDNVTTAANITYLIYVSDRTGGQRFDGPPTYTTKAGETFFAVKDLTPSTTYYFVVRANNEQGLLDNNTAERAATTLKPAAPPTSADLAPPMFGGLASAAANTGVSGQVDLTWSAASDDRTSASQMTYRVYQSTTPGVHDYVTATYTTPPGITTYHVEGLTLGTYYFVVRARDEAGNMDVNRVERSASTGSITATAGTPQQAPVSTAFTALQATVRDATGKPVAATVTFSAPAAGASGTFAGGATTAQVQTVDGVATSPPFTANALLGTYTVQATASNLPAATFALTNTASLPATITATAGTPQSASINTQFAAPLQVTVRDVSGAPLDAAVTFTAPAAGPGGVFAEGATTATVQTVNGVATSPPFTANGLLGSYTVQATTGNLPPATFALTNTPAGTITATAGILQSAMINTAFPVPLQATVRDPSGTPRDAVVTFTAPATGASGVFALVDGKTAAIASVQTVNGVATAPPFTANGVGGYYQVSATVAGLQQATFTLLNQTRVPALVIETGGSFNGVTEVGTQFQSEPQVRVEDATGTLMDALVTFSCPDVGASCTFAGPNGPTKSVTVATVAGIATCPPRTANTVAGLYGVSASVAYGIGWGIEVANTPGPPASITVIEGSGQQMAPETIFEPLRVKVSDRFGNGAAGATVTWTLSGPPYPVVFEDGTTAPHSLESDYWTGEASLWGLIAYSPGVSTITASAGNAPPVFFELRVLQAGPQAGKARKQRITR